CRVKISGNPILSDADKDYVTEDGNGIIMANPRRAPPSEKQRQAALVRQQLSADGSGVGAHENKDMVRMTFDRLSTRERESAEEARSLREQLLKSSNGNGGMNQQSLRMIQDAADRAIEAERRAAERQREEVERIRQEEKENKREFEGLIARMGERNTGIPPEMLQTLNESHRSEINGLNESHRAEMRQERDRADRELATVRERYEAEIKVIDDKYRNELERTRSDLQSRLDREVDNSKREIDRIRDQSKVDLDKTREELTRRLDDKEKDHLRLMDQEREQARLRLESAESRAKSERSALTSQHQMQVEHLKSMQTGQIEQLNATNTASMSMQKSTFEAQIAALTSELDRTRSDLQATQIKVNEQGDLATQASKLREIGDSLGSVFGLGKPTELGMATPASMDVEPEPKKNRPEGWMGSLMDLADSNLGQMAFEFFRQAAVGAAGPAPGMMPPGLPGQYGPPPGAYGPPSGYPSQPQPNPYGGMPQQQPVYGPPQQPSYQPPFPQPQGPYSEFVDNELDDEIYDAGPPDEGSFGPEAQNVAVASEPQPSEPVEPAPASSIPTPPQMEGATEEKTSASEASSDDIPPEVRQQLEGLVQGLESAMTNGQSPEELAVTILQIAPAEQLAPFASTPINQLVEDIGKIVPGTILASYNGRKYLQQLQKVLSQKVSS
ncbi:MAG: hypothetical protein ACYS5V_05160, partial [Planctomycetota bacterium]